MLAERLNKAWRERQATVPLRTAITFAPEGMVLGAGAVLAPAASDGRGDAIRLKGLEARLAALLSAAHLRPIDNRALNHIRKAAECWSHGRSDLAEVHLALSGVDKLDSPAEASHRLFLADSLMQAGLEPDAILRALGLDPSSLGVLAKDYQTQPRVPKGSGRPSGQWTTDPSATEAGDSQSDTDQNGTPAAANAEPQARLIPARYDARNTSAAKPRGTPAPDLFETPRIVTPVADRPWFMSLTGAQLGELALFVARFAGPTAALGALFIPFNKSLTVEDTIAGWPPIHFRWRSDERVIAFSFRGPDLRQISTTAEFGQDGLFRDFDNKVIGRLLPDGGIVIDRSAILPKELREENEPTLCPKPVPDRGHGNLNGLRFENLMKALVNPGNPTPSKYGIAMLNPLTSRNVMLDDCQRRSGILFDYKGPMYSWLLSTSFSGSVLGKLADQASRQVSASEGRPIVWIFAEKDASEFVKEAFDAIPGLKGRIQFDYEPMKGRSI